MNVRVAKDHTQVADDNGCDCPEDSSRDATSGGTSRRRVGIIKNNMKLMFLMVPQPASSLQLAPLFPAEYRQDKNQ
jgi:hypothetical protein